MKPTILLTTTLFLLSAPWPDAKTLSDLTAGFLSKTNEHALLAAEVVQGSDQLSPVTNADSAQID